MSTFNGQIAEFPNIRVDHFRILPGSTPPLACFLSHVHSDHLAGLESLRSPFVYCSAATRQILLRLERYPCRINYAKGILEARQQTFKHLHKVLKPLPLNTPTCIELEPGRGVQVTLLDANHCPGAVMFLIEGERKAVLYTGDFRGEPWFVNSITQNPTIVEYASGIRTLDTIYLDTSFTDNVPFQTKADGIRELLNKVVDYPSDTVFHFQAWTYGYEDVWIALAKALQSQIHVDDYKLSIYQSLQARQSSDDRGPTIHLSPEAPALVGFLCGNRPHPGYLTSNTNVRLHSCEKGNMCAVAQGQSVVRIQPVVAHLPTGGNIPEAGVGGGGDDLEREAELDLLSNGELQEILARINTVGSIPSHLQQGARDFLMRLASHGRNVPLNLDIPPLSEGSPMDLEQVIRAIAKKSLQASSTGPTASSRADSAGMSTTAVEEDQHGIANMPKTIRFPFSRHSSYPELCAFVDAFQPKDVWPCTVDPNEWIRNDTTIESLFGRFCSEDEFCFDEFLRARRPVAVTVLSRDDSQQAYDTQRTLISSPEVGSFLEPAGPTVSGHEHVSSVRGEIDSPSSMPQYASRYSDMQPSPEPAAAPNSNKEQGRGSSAQQSDNPSDTGGSRKRHFDECGDSEEERNHNRDKEPEGNSQQSQISLVSHISYRDSAVRRDAYTQMRDLARGDEDWVSVSLISTDAGHTTLEKDLGSSDDVKGRRHPKLH